MHNQEAAVAIVDLSSSVKQLILSFCTNGKDLIIRCSTFLVVFCTQQ